jgi:hypothetical protein
MVDIPLLLKRTSFTVRNISAIENRTPFAHWCSFSLNKWGEVTATCVLRATYLIQGEIVSLSPKQEQIRLADIYYGRPGKSSLRLASDLAPFKPLGDVLFRDPIARSPKCQLSTEWQVNISIGNLSYSFDVTAESHWRKTFAGRKELRPKPCRRVPVIYEFAESGESENPLGCDKSHDADRLPRVRSIKSQHVGNSHRFAGLGPIPGGWKCRARFAGTYDECWKEIQWPLLPSDFDYEFYNVAHPALRNQGYFRGDEVVSVVGLSGDPINFRLPANSNPLLELDALRSTNNYFATFNLDTIEIDTNCMMLSLVWRAAFAPPEEVVCGRLVTLRPLEVRHAT